MYVQNEAKSVCGILETYPKLNRPTLVWLYVVCYFILWSFIQIETEMALIVNDNSIRKSFQKRWLEFLPAILHYGERESKKKKGMKNALCELHETGNDTFYIYVS